MPFEATQRLRSPLQAYRDHASRNWPIWWSLKLGMPLGYALAIVLLMSIIGTMVDVSIPRIHGLESCPNCPPGSSVPYEFRTEVDRVGVFMILLTTPSLVIGTLFSFLWFFYIARSFKFANAPLLGRQPKVWPLMLVGCGLLWVGLVGLKVFQWRYFSSGLFDVASLGSLYSRLNANDDSYISILRGESYALPNLMVFSGLVCYGAIFLVLYRQGGIGAALSGLIFQILSLGASIGIISILNGVGIKSDLTEVLVVVVPLSIPPLFGLYTLITGRRARGLSTLGISTLLYLVSFGPMWIYLTFVSAQYPWARELVADKQIVVYLLCFVASVGAGEVFAKLQYRNRLQPAA